MDTTRKQILDKLNSLGVPDPCHLNFRERKGFEGMNNVIKRMESEISLEDSEANKTTFSEIEIHMKKNLLTHLYMEVDGKASYTSATKMNEACRQQDPNSIIALVNYVRLLAASDDNRQALLQLGRIESLKLKSNYKEIETTAMGEIAYYCNRFVATHGDEAIRFFKTLLDGNPENWLRPMWSYSYGLAIQRKFGVDLFYNSSIPDASSLFIHGFEALKEVTKCSDPKLASLAWVKMGSMMNRYWHNVPKKYRPNDNAVFRLCYDTRQNAGHKELLNSCRCVETDGNRAQNKLFTCCCIRIALKIAPPDHFSFLQECGRFYRRRTPVRDLEEAERLLMKSYEITPTSFNCEHLGLIFVDRWEEGRRLIKQANRPGATGEGKIPVVPNLDGLNLQKESDSSNTDLTKALKFFEEARKYSQDDSSVLTNMGLVYRRLNCPEEATTCFKDIISRNRCTKMSKMIAYEQQGFCYVECANKANDREKSNIFLKEAFDMFFRGITIAVGMPFRYESSAGLLEDLLKMEAQNNPQDTDPRSQLARLKRLLGDNSSALQYLDEVLALDPENFDAELKRANVLLEKGQYNKGYFENILKKSDYKKNVRETKPKLVQFFLDAAKQSLQEDRRTDAKEYFKRAYQIVFDTGNDGEETQSNVYITGKDLGDHSHFGYFSEVISEYFGLNCSSSADITPGEFENLLSSVSIEKCSVFLFVFPDSGDLDHESLHDVEAAISCVRKKKPGTYSLISVQEDTCNIPPSLRNLKVQNVTGYRAWKAEDSKKRYRQYVMELFEAIIKPRVELPTTV